YQVKKKRILRRVSFFCCRPVSRVLSSPAGAGQVLSFIWDPGHPESLTAYPFRHIKGYKDEQPFLCRLAEDRNIFGLSTRKVYHASLVTLGAVGSYPTFSPLPAGALAKTDLPALNVYEAS